MLGGQHHGRRELAITRSGHVSSEPTGNITSGSAGFLRRRTRQSLAERHESPESAGQREQRQRGDQHPGNDQRHPHSS